MYECANWWYDKLYRRTPGRLPAAFDECNRAGKIEQLHEIENEVSDALGLDGILVASHRNKAT